MEDNRIIDLYWERNENALTQTAEKYGKLCYSIAFNLLNNNEDSEECVDDTYLSAWNLMPPQRPAFLSAFLAKITRNNAFNRIKYSKRKKRSNSQPDILLSELEECLPSNQSADESLNESYVAELISNYLRSISKNKATLFIFRYFFCYSIDELSAKSGYTKEKITSMLYRMRCELKIKLKEGGVEI